MNASPASRDAKRLGLSPSVWKLVTAVYCALVCLPVLVAAGLIYGPGEHWWPTTLVLFGPLWLLQLPLAFGFVLWALADRRWTLLGLLAASELVLNIVVLGFNIPWKPSAEEHAPVLRVANWNLAGQALTAPLTRRLFETHRVDLAIFQECSGLPPESEFPALQRHENLGMCLLSTLPLKAVEDRDRQDVWQAAGSGAIVRYTLEASWGAFTVTNVHLETPREGFEAFFDDGASAAIHTLTAKNQQRYAEARLAKQWTTQGTPLPRLVGGDFNTTPQSDVLRETWDDYTNCFGAVGFGFGHTKETRLLGVRIDHLLASQEWTCLEARVGEGFDSDHDPVFVEVALLNDFPMNRSPDEVK